MHVVSNDKIWNTFSDNWFNITLTIKIILLTSTADISENGIVIQTKAPNDNEIEVKGNSSCSRSNEVANELPNIN